MASSLSIGCDLKVGLAAWANRSIGRIAERTRSRCPRCTLRRARPSCFGSRPAGLGPAWRRAVPIGPSGVVPSLPCHLEDDGRLGPLHHLQPNGTGLDRRATRTCRNFGLVCTRCRQTSRRCPIRTTRTVNCQNRQLVVEYPVDDAVTPGPQPPQAAEFSPEISPRSSRTAPALPGKQPHLCGGRRFTATSARRRTSPSRVKPLRSSSTTVPSPLRSTRRASIACMVRESKGCPTVCPS